MSRATIIGMGAPVPGKFAYLVGWNDIFAPHAVALRLGLSEGDMLQSVQTCEIGDTRKAGHLHECGFILRFILYVFGYQSDFVWTQHQPEVCAVEMVS